MPIVIASENVHKAQELKNILEHKLKNLQIILQTQFKIGAVSETGLTFVENAILKARHACYHSNLPAIADDSGIEVTALNNQPGIYSARFAGNNASYNDNIAKLIATLRNTPKTERQACFRCVIVFLKTAADPSPIICQGTWQGEITFEPIGDNGFGYDPVFWVPQYKCTAAQLPPTIKNKISHRAQAIKKLVAILKQEINLHEHTQHNQQS